MSKAFTAETNLDRGARWRVGGHRFGGLPFQTAQLEYRGKTTGIRSSSDWHDGKRTGSS